MSVARYIPNALSFLRILCAPLLLYFLVERQQSAAFATLLVGTLSDFFDGYLARLLGVETRLGALLDPLADKVFSNVALWGLYFSTPPTLPLFLIALSLSIRDVVLLCGAGVALSRKLHINMSPVYVSKVCTACVFVFVALSMLSLKDDLYILLFGYTCVALILLSFTVYIWRYVKSTRS
ncbi:MAG: CDP-alcohol phosphatidyltransferase family protein [Alphaproteobacteria bacterium]|nr:CDP-alcohol phosphatidyltransferase family protein [Alphaproteobacteria bacterium]